MEKKTMEVYLNSERELEKRDKKIYGHFIEHFHRQIYNGIFDPDFPLSDEEGFRRDIIEAVKNIDIPILRWPGGCFVSSYHWKEGVGENRTPFFDKAWRVEDPNTFGTDEFISLCKKLECEPYICTNAGTGSAEEMSDWLEYCNLKDEGQYAKWRIKNGSREPHNVKYWSIGNENYGHWEIGAKSAEEWGRLVREAAKMMKHVDPTAELSAAALADIDWNINLLKEAGDYLDWISIHEYWDMMAEENNPASYQEVMAFTKNIDHSIKEVRGLLEALNLENEIKIAFDEWNLRSWHHPNVHTVKQGVNKKDYLDPRDKNDDNSQYTMADAVFAACFLNTLNKNSDLIKMANFAPLLNTRGCIYSYAEGIVLRPTYHVFDLYVNYLGDIIIDLWTEDMPEMKVISKNGEAQKIKALDLLATKWSDKKGTAVAAVNKDPDKNHKIKLNLKEKNKKIKIYSLSGKNKDSYNDINKNEVEIKKEEPDSFNNSAEIELKTHSVNIIQII